MIFNKQSVIQKREKLHSKKDRITSASTVSICYVCAVAAVFIIVCLMGFSAGAVSGMLASAPNTDHLEPSNSATTIYDSDNKPIQFLSDYSSNRIIVSENQLPDHLKNAFIAIEDERFYEHEGVDIKGIARAVFSALKNGGKATQGASTITQQLIKNNKFNVGGESNFAAKIKRKIQEQYLALEVEKKYSKEEILRDYLNSINLGKGSLGVEAASRYYFQKSVENLTLCECAVLAAITKNPTNLNPVDNPENNNERRKLVLKKMFELNFISNEEYQEALKDDIYSKINKNATEASKQDKTYSYFTDAVIVQVVEDLKNTLGYTQEQAYNMVYRSGLHIYSTQDTSLQKLAVNIINNKANYPKGTKYSLEYTLEVTHSDGNTDTYNEKDVQSYYAKKNKDKDYKTLYSSKEAMQKAAQKFRKTITKKDDTYTENIYYSLQPQLSYSLIDQSTGEIKVLVGGRGKKFDNLSLNRATSAPRQPGSTFKILSTYAPALDNGSLTLASIFDDAPYNYENGTPVHNYVKDSYGGLTTVRNAIINSNNIVAVKALTALTPQVGYDYLTKLGFTTLVNNREGTNGSTESDINQSLALGGITDGVTNVELTAAYAAIANGGEYNKPILYTKVEDSNGNIILENKKNPQRVMKQTTSWLLTNAMEDVVSEGTGRDAQLSSDMAVAGKTGTTSNNYDYWFCGYTPYYTASIWTGYDYQTSFDNDSDYHKVIWAKIMDKIIKKKELAIKGFKKCKGITTATICEKSGKLAVSGLCSHDPEKSMAHKEYFVKGTEPTNSCDKHTSVVVCTKSGKAAGKYCPDSNKVTKVYRIRTKNSSSETDDAMYYLPYGLKNSSCTYHTKAWHDKLLEQKRKEEAEKKAKQKIQEELEKNKNKNLTDILKGLTDR